MSDERIDDQRLAHLAVNGMMEATPGRLDAGANRTLRSIARELFHARRAIMRLEHAELCSVTPVRKHDVEAAIHDGEMGGLLVEIEQLKRTIEDRERGLRQRDEQLREWRRWAEHATDTTEWEDDVQLRDRLYSMVVRSKQEIKDERDAKIAELTTKLEAAQANSEAFERVAMTKFVRACAFANSNGSDPKYWTIDMVAEMLERGTWRNEVFPPPDDHAPMDPSTDEDTPF